MKKKGNSFVFFLGEYLNVHLPKQRNCSKHTVMSARQTWNMLLTFICMKTGKRVGDIGFEDLSRSSIVEFLDTYENERRWSPATRNQRLSSIRSFFYYASGLERTLVVYSEPLRSIPRKKGIDKSRILKYMQPEAMAAILRQPDISTKKGVRDTFFMVLMFDTAARDCEMLSMPFNALDPVRKTVYLLGKGNKPRIVPIGDETVNHFHRFANLFHSGSGGEKPMFYTVRHGVMGFMSDDNVAKFLKKYASLAKVGCPDVPVDVTPHMVRKTRAMQLYRQGMPLATLAQWLGHEDPETTLIYAKADTEMKRRAIEAAEAASPILVFPEDKATAVWEGNDDMIKRLCGLQ